MPKQFSAHVLAITYVLEFLRAIISVLHYFSLELGNGFKAKPESTAR